MLETFVAWDFHWNFKIPFTKHSKDITEVKEQLLKK